MRLLLILCALLLVACQPRPEPLSRGLVLSAAANRAEHLGLDWGSPRSAVPPDGPDATTGRLLWQVFFDDDVDGAARVMLVNHYSGWAQVAPEGTVLRSLLHPVTPEEVARTRPVRGTWILVLDEAPADADRDDLAARIAAWNDTALANGLYPLFGERPLADGASELIYGWHEEGGIPRIESLEAWIARRLEMPAEWVDLSAGE